MRVLLLVACALAAVAAEDKMVKMAATTDKLELNPVLFDKLAFKQAIEAQFPTAESFALNLMTNPDKYGIKHEIASAFNLTEELEHWKKDGNPTAIPFTDDSGMITYGTETEGSPIATLSVNYNRGVRFHFFSKYDEKDINGVLMEPDMLMKIREAWDPKLPLKVIIHGFTNTIKSPIIQDIKNAYLKTGKYNVIGVDWGDLCAGPWYPGARGHVSGAGTRVAEMLDMLVEAKMTEPALMHLIGHSLGAHVAGIAGKSMSHGPVKRITGLDPAGPLFWFTKSTGTIWHTDAELVDIIHSNTGFLGKSAQLGDVDFYLNGGDWQPGCTGRPDEIATCSHGRSYVHFINSILSKDRADQGELCPHLPDHPKNCLRERSEFQATLGDDIQFKRQGPYYVSTSRIVPFDS